MQARGDDGEQAVNQCEQRRVAVGSEREQKSALFVSRAADDCERLQVGRLLAACNAGGEDINDRLVREGWAPDYCECLRLGDDGSVGRPPCS